MNVEIILVRLALDLAPTLARKLALAVTYNIISNEFHVMNMLSWPQIIISEYNETYHTSNSCYYVLDLLCVMVDFSALCSNKCQHSG